MLLGRIRIVPIIKKKLFVVSLLRKNIVLYVAKKNRYTNDVSKILITRPEELQIVREEYSTTVDMHS